MTEDRLVLDLLGDRHVVEAGGALTFGRRADLVVDHNPFMHRVVGRVVHREDVWWVQNHGATTRLELHDLESHVVHVVGPGGELPVTADRFTIRFASGPTTYEIDGERHGPRRAVSGVGDPTGTATVDFGSVPLSPEQHLLLVALLESSRRNDGAIEGNAVIARRLGWTPKKFHRKLDAICDKLARQGVRGVKGELGGAADLRRNRVLEHALGAGLISAGDLGLLRAQRPA